MTDYDLDNNGVLNFNEYVDMVNSFSRFYGTNCSDFALGPLSLQFQILACTCGDYPESDRHDCICSAKGDSLALPTTPPIYPQPYYDEICETTANVLRTSVECEGPLLEATMAPYLKPEQKI